MSTGTARRAGGVVLALTAGLALVLLVSPGRAAPAFHVWLLATLAVGLLAALAELRSAVASGPSAFDAALRRSEPVASRPASLVRLEREVAMSAETAFDEHYRLRPILRPVAAGLALADRSVDLDRRPEAARALLGDEAWELLRPDRPPPGDRSAAGPGAAGVERLVSAVERLSWS